MNNPYFLPYSPRTEKKNRFCHAMETVVSTHFDCLLLCININSFVCSLKYYDRPKSILTQTESKRSLGTRMFYSVVSFQPNTGIEMPKTPEIRRQSEYVFTTYEVKLSNREKHKGHKVNLFSKGSIPSRENLGTQSLFTLGGCL